MTKATVLCVSLLCGCTAASPDSNPRPVIACNLKAIRTADRPRYNELLTRLRAAVRDRGELTAGYAYKLESKGLTLREVAEWMSMERLCCPFLNLQLSAAGNQSGWVLSLTGPPGVKALLQAEFPDR